ncbi:TspO/MBR family protein [Jejuia spongiicola]|uniref:Tryptophan-rich sensory protein n=1 Tax=Jejuia spongiicola TaxID=2942207 RepID=A0ABT0QGY1_9FLAO|nr:MULTISPECIES: TspO/MBR family protein [Flavobacteriaceae]MCL6296109.1 tryptophan-rich sensory protein [Jejuia spongiicola]PIA80300.1 TspO protein [Gaetbulibacter sp. 4G1]
MKLLKYIILFLIVNFGALYIGNLLMNNGPQTDWYINLNKAPWTPPGWVFGAAWTLIMICFSIYMAFLFKLNFDKKVFLLFTVQFILNVIWNYIFFNQHLITLGLIVIMLLTAIVSIFLYDYKKVLELKSILILPYFIWLCIATSLNMYILIHN